MQLWLVTEYHAHGSLFDYLSENTISGPVMLQMLRSIANGLAFLHAEVPGMHSMFVVVISEYEKIIKRKLIVLFVLA